LSSSTSATTLRGLSSLIDRIWPAGTPSKLTGPPRRRPLAEPPSNTTRNWLRLWMERHLCTPRRPPNPTAITASVAGPITTMPGGTLGGCVVQHDQRIDRNAGPGVDQERIDVDRGDPVAGIRDQVGQADQRLHRGGLMQGRFAAIAAHLDAGLGAADQQPRL